MLEIVSLAVIKWQGNAIYLMMISNGPPRCLTHRKCSTLSFPSSLVSPITTRGLQSQIHLKLTVTTKVTRASKIPSINSCENVKYHRYYPTLR